MKKILMAFDYSNFSEGAFEIARRLNELHPILLTGVFLPQPLFGNLWNYADGIAGPYSIPVVADIDETKMAANIAKFEKKCIGNGINFRIHKEGYDFALAELKKETRLADLLILGSETFYEDTKIEMPNDYLEEALHKVECPVLVVPENFNFPKSVILAYDGTASSVYAIKQFVYIFPELSNIAALLIYASTDEQEDFPDKIRIEELAARHFSDLTLLKLDIDPKKHFATWMLEKESSLLVCGSFGRSKLSEMFKKSFIREVIGDHKIPVFIAHQ